LQNTNLVVDAFNQTETHFVLGIAVGGNTLPMGFNQLGELPVRFQTLPFQAVFPAFEKSPGTAFATVVPQLGEGLLENLRSVQAPVRLE
jgi:hypothetical protein